MNVAEQMHKAVAALEAGDFGSLVSDLEKECEDEWSRNYAIIQVTLDEPMHDCEYDSRDFDAVRERVIEEICKSFPGIRRRDIRKPGSKMPQRGYEMVVHGLAHRFDFEVECYSVAWARRSK